MQARDQNLTRNIYEVLLEDRKGTVKSVPFYDLASGYTGGRQ